MALAAAAAGGVAAAAYFDGKYQLRRELNIILKLKAAEREYNWMIKHDRVSPWYLLAGTCKRRANDRAIWTREGTLTFNQLHDQVVRYAQWMLDEGIRPGDLVALYLHNSAEFLILMYATLCIGAGPAMINYNLEGKALMHCLGVCNSKLLIIDPDSGCQQRINDSRGEIEGAGTKIVTLDESSKQRVSSRPAIVPEDKWRNGMTGSMPFCLIYTSGTTGMPKGCPFLISRVHLIGGHRNRSFGTAPGKDCWYSPMPLYHGTGLLTSSISLLSGVGIAIAPRFSVSNFWPDVYDSGSTLFIYVGETARYLLAAPPHPLERAHKLRCMYGNGLRPDVWQKFQDRFNIPQVAEFFNSSEGMFALLVWDRGPYLRGCVGHHGLIFRTLMYNTYVPVQFDYEAGDIWRDAKTGFARRTPYEEGGEILVSVPDKEAFGGYWRNPEATNKRFAVDVFKKGDVYYRCGDALRRSPDGHWYFLDRLGDTFRWKSENVSTAEVALALGEYAGIAEANVYGVTVPGHEGKAGCAALALTSAVDYTDLASHCRARLPRYAVPVFLRIVKRSSHIHNHKQNKVGLRGEGVDPDKPGTEEKEGGEDVFLWLKPGKDTYAAFERREWESLSALYNSALRQSKAIRADLDAFAASPTSSAALQGQLTTSLTSFSRTLDDYQRAVEVELQREKADKGKERIANFRQELLDCRSRFAELKHEKEQAQLANNRNELLGRRPHASQTPENPYADAAITSGAGRGEHVNPLFRTSNPNFQPGGGGANAYSAYASPYGTGAESAQEDHALRENSFFNSANTTLDEYIERGRAVLGDLGDQRELLKNTQKKLYSVGTTLGISGDTIRMVERRAKQDKWIFWAGVVVFVIFVYLVIRWLR